MIPKKIIDDLLVLCTNEDCQWKGNFSFLAKHLKDECEKEKNKKIKIENEINSKEIIEVSDSSLTIENPAIEISDQDNDYKILSYYFLINEL